MSSSAIKPSKQGSLTSDFLRKAATDPNGALAVMFLSAFGVTMHQLAEAVKSIIADKNIAMFMLAVTAGVQIRAHSVFVGKDHGGARAKYSFLIIEGDRPQKDSFNFGALHALGHCLAALSLDPNAKRVTAKAGNCITGSGFTANEAGNINQEIFKGWSSDDRSLWNEVSGTLANNPELAAMFQAIPKLAKEFGVKV